MKFPAIPQMDHKAAKYKRIAEAWTSASGGISNDTIIKDAAGKHAPKTRAPFDNGALDSRDIFTKKIGRKEWTPLVCCRGRLLDV